jgi:hypothetical protein
MEQPPLELRKLRDFGQVISDSFTFFKENFKPLLTALITICGFLLLIEATSTAFTYVNMGNMYSNMRTGSFTGASASYLLSVLFNSLVLLLTQMFITMVTLSYISVYLQKNNEIPTLADVWGYFKYYFFRIIGSGILITLIAILGFVLCIIPFFYLLPMLYLIIPIIIIENSSFKYALDKSFRIIKGNWWFVFGVIIVMGIIVAVVGSIATIPLTIITGANQFLSVKSISMPMVILFSLLHSVITLSYCLPTIAVTLCYFDLSEQKDGTGLLSRIDKIGLGNTNNTTLPPEEY